ncbi:MAG TPA: response regulator transcription factor [bacterium]|nr:response regulator transcription factor [bacterium]
MSEQTLITLVPDELKSRLQNGFARAGMTVENVEEPRALLQSLFTRRVNAIIADAALIADQIKSICQILETENKTALLILLTNSEQIMAKIYALEDGADICFDQPVQIEELVAQVKALFRRCDRIREVPRDLTIKDIHINLNTHEVRKNGSLIDLTYTQFKLLYLLASQREIVFSRNDILKKVWGENAYVTDRTVDVHVKRLREKLGEGKQTSRYIQTIHGLGYRLA